MFITWFPGRSGSHSEIRGLQRALSDPTDQRLPARGLQRRRVTSDEAKAGGTGGFGRGTPGREKESRGIGALNIDGTGLNECYSVYQGHLFLQKATYELR